MYKLHKNIDFNQFNLFFMKELGGKKDLINKVSFVYLFLFHYYANFRCW